jgi:hypothetical protein
MILKHDQWAMILNEYTFPLMSEIFLHAHGAISRLHSLELWTGRLSVAYGMCSDKIFIQIEKGSITK